MGNLKLGVLRLLLGGLAILILSSVALAGSVHKTVPADIDPDAKYLFYMHGKAIEEMWGDGDSYLYLPILDRFAERGFVVIGEKRTSFTKPDEYAGKVAGQVVKLLKAGVPGRNITVAGHSKGGMITMWVMTLLRDPDISYVNFAGCGLPQSETRHRVFQMYVRTGASEAHGRLLSAYDHSDSVAGSCKDALDRMTEAEVAERVLDIGGDHQLFYRPDDAWMDVLQAWVERRLD